MIDSLYDYESIVRTLHVSDIGRMFNGCANHKTSVQMYS